MSFFTCIISSVPTNASFNSSMVVTSVAAFTVVANAITTNNYKNYQKCNKVTKM